jgi:hypothetical protein
MEVGMKKGKDGGSEHPLKRLMENTWLLLVLGVVIPTVSFTLWAWLEILILPKATLP